jgi:hypothetical protein
MTTATDRPGTPRFDCVTASTSSCPSERFLSESEALAWARVAACRHGRQFDVWRVVNGRHKRVATFDPK